MNVYCRDTLLNIGSTIFKLQLYPVFDVCHYLLTIISVRDDEQPICGEQKSRVHPFPRWITSLFACFAGSVIGNVLLGEPMLSDMRDNEKVLIITVIWYLIFYSPFDSVYRLLKCRFTRIFMFSFKEVQRVRKIHDAVMHASHLFPGAYVLMVLLGTVKGCGTYLVLAVSRLIFAAAGANGVGVNFTHLSTTSKASAITAILFMCQRERMIDVNKYLMSVGILAFLFYLRIVTVFFPNHEPFSILENLLTGLFFGGWWDAMERACKKVATNASSSSNRRDPNCAEYKAITESDKIKESKKRD